MSAHESRLREFGLFRANLSVKHHRTALTTILASYMADPMGNTPPHSSQTATVVMDELQLHPRCMILFGSVNLKPVGAAVCFINYSTFAAAPFVNIHDLAVLPEFRYAGIGRALLAGVELFARDTGCCRVTLEAREDNGAALSLYSRCGFEHCNPPMHYLRKELSAAR